MKQITVIIDRFQFDTNWRVSCPVEVETILVTDSNPCRSDVAIRSVIIQICKPGRPCVSCRRGVFGLGMAGPTA